MRRRALAVLVTLAAVGAASRARAQIPGTEGMTQSSIDLNEEPTTGHYRSPQHFAVELRFGPWLPDIDSEFHATDGVPARTPYRDYYGTSSHLMTQAEFDVELYHKLGTAAVGFGVGYFQVSGTAPFDTGAPSGDKSTLRVVPLSLLGIYRFDYFLEKRNVPLVPFVKLGLNWAYWQNTDGNGQIAMADNGGKGSGGTFGWEAATGLALVLDMFDPDAAKDFDTDLGVNHTAVLIQFVHADISGLGESNRLHVGDNTWSAGILVQF
jgi:hypothetical protein